jgi:uncharacterized protein
MSHNILLLTTALLAGFMNSVAGGGGLITFPMLVIVGVPPLNANATNTVALWFGTLTSTFAYRQELSKQRKELALLSGISVIGGFFGSYLLLSTSPVDFAALVPYLMLTATLLFTFGQPLVQQLTGASRLRLPLIVILILQFAIATYGGYFGGGGGILILAVLNVMGIQNIHTMNAFKTWLATCLNAAAIIYFTSAHIVFWFQAIFMAIAAAIGGYGGVYLAKKLHPKWVRYFIIGVGFAMTGYFFIHNIT